MMTYLAKHFQRVLPACFFLLLLCLGTTAISQPQGQKISVRDYIDRYREIALRKMRDHKIPASITLSQGILESANGNSTLARLANNHFGIKCHKEWQGDTYYMDDDKENECFRKYRTAEESFEDHSVFLCTKSRYAFLFELPITDYKAWAYGLKKAGYATSATYAEKLIRIIEDNQLQLIDQEGLGLVGPGLAFSIDSLPASYRQMFEGEDFDSIRLGMTTRKIWHNNGIRMTLALKKDDPGRIARDCDLMSWQVLRFNELKKGDRLAEGQIIYLQPKKRKASKSFHTVRDKETMYIISQVYGVKTKFLYRKNRMAPGTQPVTGQKLWLRKKKPSITR